MRISFSAAISCLLYTSDKRIYEIAQQVSGVKNEKILFVENSPEHLQAAKDFGWQTFAYDSQTPNESSRELMNFLNKNNF